MAHITIQLIGMFCFFQNSTTNNQKGFWWEGGGDDPEGRRFDSIAEIQWCLAMAERRPTFAANHV